MIKRGKEDADNMHNILPLFQKKIKDPLKAIGPKVTQGTKSMDIKRRSEKLKKESNRLQEAVFQTEEGHELRQMETGEEQFGMD